MRTKLYFIALAIIWLLSSCTPTPNVSKSKYIGMGQNGMICEQIIDQHSYISFNGGVAHSGTCQKCKQELDSIIRKVIREEVGK